jgi:hypothetical protein
MEIMTFNRLLIAACTALLLGAWPAITTASSIDELTAAVSGKTLITETSEIQVGSDGALTGKVGQNLDTELSGTWEIRDGQWCRTITAPARLAGSACQAMTLNNDGTVTIDGANGPIVYTVR